MLRDVRVTRAYMHVQGGGHMHVQGGGHMHMQGGGHMHMQDRGHMHMQGECPEHAVSIVCIRSTCAAVRRVAAGTSMVFIKALASGGTRFFSIAVSDRPKLQLRMRPSSSKRSSALNAGLR